MLCSVMVIPDLPPEVDLAGYFELPSDPREKRFLQELYNHYFIEAPLTYAAAKADMTLEEAIDVMKKYDLPQFRPDKESNKQGLLKLNHILSFF